MWRWFICLALGFALPGAAVAAVKVEAVIEDYTVGAGKDGSDQLKSHYSNETLANMGSIMKARGHSVCSWCWRSLTASLSSAMHPLLVETQL